MVSECRAPMRYRAVSMGLSADYGERCVEIHFLFDTGETIAVMCPRDSIFAIQRHIAELVRECPEIATWAAMMHLG